MSCSRPAAIAPQALQSASNVVAARTVTLRWINLSCNGHLAKCERPETLRVFGRLPATGARACTEAGVRKASREETAGESASAALSGYGDLAPAFDLIFRSRVGTAGERALRRCCRSPGLRTER